MEYKFFAKNNSVIDEISKKIIEVFKLHEKEISLETNRLTSNQVLSIIKNDLMEIGFNVEKGVKKEDRIYKNFLNCDFYLDAYNEEKKYIIEIEAGRAIENYQILKDLFEACVIDGVNYICIAVKLKYPIKIIGAKHRYAMHYKKSLKFLDAFIKSNVKTQLKGILLIGY